MLCVHGSCNACHKCGVGNTEPCPSYCFYTTNLSIGTHPTYGGFGRLDNAHVMIGVRQLLGLARRHFTKQMALHEAPLHARPHAALTDDNMLAQLSTSLGVPVLGFREHASAKVPAGYPYYIRASPGGKRASSAIAKILLEKRIAYMDATRNQSQETVFHVGQHIPNTEILEFRAMNSYFKVHVWKEVEKKDHCVVVHAAQSIMKDDLYMIGAYLEARLSTFIQMGEDVQI